MQATLPPVWSEIERYRRRRGRITLSELTEITARAHQLHLQSQLFHLTPQEIRRLSELHARLDWPRPRPEILLYSPAQIRQLIRLGSSPIGPPDGGSLPRPSPGPGHLGAPWHLPDRHPSSAPHSSEFWWRGAKGWGAGALLLVAALLLVRATDRCFTKGYRSRRRRSEEWSTPNVLATSQQSPSTLQLDLPPVNIYPSDISDPPPPYSAPHEDPPPPYSIVAFNNKLDSPTVHIITDNEQAHASNRFTANTSNDNHKTDNESHKVTRVTDDTCEEMQINIDPIGSRERIDIQNDDSNAAHSRAC